MSTNAVVSWYVARHNIFSKWRFEVPLNHLVVKNQEHPISDRKRSNTVNEEAMDIKDISTEEGHCEDLRFLKRKLS